MLSSSWLVWLVQLNIIGHSSPNPQSELFTRWIREIYPKDATMDEAAVTMQGFGAFAILCMQTDAQ